jgi:hypothetical protein
MIPSSALRRIVHGAWPIRRRCAAQNQTFGDGHATRITEVFLGGEPRQ